jgi:hypothetical protein
MPTTPGSDLRTTPEIEDSPERGRDTEHQQKLIDALEACIEDFREGKATKFDSLAEIMDLLERHPGSIANDKETALKYYISTLDLHEEQANVSNKWGLHAVGLRQGFAANEPISGYRGHASERSHSHKSSQRKRRSSSSPSSSSSSNRSRSSHRDGGHSNKKRRVYESQMPWYSTELEARKKEATEHQSITREYLKIFARDYAFAKKKIRLSKMAPQGFPDTEWDHIIRGDPVDLDVVLSSLHHIAPIKENLGCMGSTQISLGQSDPTRKITTSGEWSSAWNAAARAITFAFPHRKEELREYGEYMDSEFSARISSSHRKLFAFDKAVRHHVGGGQTTLLTDRNSFSFLFSAFLSPDGVEGSISRNTTNDGNRKRREQSDEICRRFNSAEGCRATSNNCRYRHLCEKCKQ